VKLRTPQRGGARDLVKLATSNAESALGRRLEARESVDATLEELRDALHLSRLPRRIECYDVSTLGGKLAVASRVVFENGLPRKSDYRRYRVREAEGGDDYGCLREVVGRRLDRVGTEPLPDLLMVDGGKGQLAVVSAALGDRDLAVDHAGIAKERDSESPSPRVRRGGGLKAERLFLSGRKDAVLLPPDSRGLLLLQRVRDEAHRFAIEFQRDLRRRVGLTSILEEVPGIGPRKRRVLLSELGSLKNVREASEAELTALPGISPADARALRRFFGALAAAGAEAAAEPARPEEGSLVPNEEPSADPDPEPGGGGVLPAG
jgi:excinuclease ABC subunit C